MKLGKRKGSVDGTADKRQKVQNGGNSESDGNKAIFISGAPFSASEEDIKAVFEGCGTIEKFEAGQFNDSGNFNGTVTITFSTPEEAAAALELVSSLLRFSVDKYSCV